MTRVWSRRKVDPPVMPAWPLWLRDLWLGWPGSSYGEDGLMRSAMRKYARQLHNGLQLASQVRYASQFVACVACVAHSRCCAVSHTVLLLDGMEGR